MADAFDSLLTVALQPPERAPDRHFVARVQARIALEDRFSQQRRAAIGAFAKQLLALGALAAGLWWLGRAAPVASWRTESPALALAVLLVAFAFFLGLVGRQSSDVTGSRASF
jgi:hypothetical protein